MPAEPESLTLAADFPHPGRDDWRALVAAVLAKAGAGGDTDPEDALSFTTYDGITIRPLYTADDAGEQVTDGRPGRPPFVRAATAGGVAAAGWDVCTRHADPDPTRLNEALLSDLETGATSLWLRVGAGGLDVADLGTALAGVLLDLAPIVLDAGAETPAATRALLAVAKAHGVDPATLSGSLGADPIGTRARTGADADLDGLRELAGLVASSPQLRVTTVDATVYHDAGASDAQELGVATSVGVAYLRALVDGGLSVDDALTRIEFRFAVTAEQFPSIAKLRAARQIWDRVAELSGAGTTRRGQRQHAVTSRAMLTRRDPWVNLLRTTIACFAAAVGGADSITVLPFDSVIGRSDAFARRIARNTHAVLHDESSLARVIDPAGGSWFVESLTDELADKAWAVFTDLERRGGALAALDSGWIAELATATHEARAEDIAHRRAAITGVSEFAFVDEVAVERESLPADPGEPLLPRRRWADDFEHLRDLTDAASTRPAVFLAGIGSLAAASARTGFAANLFQAAGLRCVSAAGETDELVAAFRESGTTVVCLCGPDKLYADHASPVAAALREAGATYVWLAGGVEAEGVDGRVFAGCDALDVLRTTLIELRVPDELGVSS